MPTTEAQVRAYLEPEEPNYQAAAAALGAEALPALETLVHGDDALLASKAAYLAALIPGERAARVLEEAARSDQPTVRVAAAAGLQKRPDVSDDMTAALIADQDQGVRKVAAKAARGRAAPAPRERGSAQRQPGKAAGGSQITEDEHGGGFSPDTDADAEPASGEGGGDLGDARMRSTQQTARDESESGGGGDLTGSARARGGRAPDGPDGGGSSGSEEGAGSSSHGGGRI
jgi:hypothetical protein